MSSSFLPSWKCITQSSSYTRRQLVCVLVLIKHQASWVCGAPELGYTHTGETCTHSLIVIVIHLGDTFLYIKCAMRARVRVFVERKVCCRNMRRVQYWISDLYSPLLAESRGACALLILCSRGHTGGNRFSFDWRNNESSIARGEINSLARRRLVHRKMRSGNAHVKKSDFLKLRFSFLAREKGVKKNALMTSFKSFVWNWQKTGWV